MDRPAKAKLASLLKKRQRSASATSSGPATRSKHSPSSSSSSASSPPTKARASSISSPDARAKAVDLLVQALRVVEGEQKKKVAEAVAGAGDKKKEGKEDASTKPASADVAVAAAGKKKKKAGGGKKNGAAGKEMAPPPAPAPSPASAATGPFSETRVREAATAIEEALHDQWKVGDHHEYNNKLRHLVFNLHRNDVLRKQVLEGTLPPTKLLSLPIEALRTDAEKDAAKAVETKEVLGYSHSHVFSDVIFEEAGKGVAGTGGGGGTGGKCQKCQSTKVLFSRRQSYNESSTWCGEEQGAPLMMNCLSCGTVESIRE